jgi:pilus assembly protein Flp/PilA
MARFEKLIRDEKGASAVEYGLIIALIVLAMMAGLGQFAATTIKMWNDIASNVARS